MDNQTALNLYKTMLLIRMFEEQLFFLFSTREMPGTIHQYNGEEAIAVGICANLRKEDYISSTHRGHGHYIAKGGNIDRLMAEMLGKNTGSNKGMGGSMHIADLNIGLLSANGIVGGGIPHAVGAAWSCKYLHSDNVAVAFFGDGAVNEGIFHESMNLASIWELPVIFVCENNQYGFSTHYKRVTNLNDLADRAKAYGMQGFVVDGMDVTKVYDLSKKIIAEVRDTKRPVLIECKTYRFRGHSRFEKSNYRPNDELAAWKARDPLIQFEKYLCKNRIADDEAISAEKISVKKLIEQSVVFADQSPSVNPDEYLKYIFA